MMKNILLTFIGALLVSTTAFAQASLLNTTTLNGAVTRNQTQITLTSVTTRTSGATFSPAIAVGQEMVVADLGGVEAMTISAINGTVVTVQRGVGGTVQRAHATLAVVLISTPNNFFTSPPGSGTGTDPGAACTRAQQRVLPYVDLSTGLLWTCGLAGSTAATTWVVVNPLPMTLNTTGLLQ